MRTGPAFLSRTGFLETAYRLPSVVCMGAALWVIAKIAARLVRPEAAWIAVFACLAMRGFNYEAADARPYAFGTLVAACAVWALIRWLDRARWFDAALFVVTAAMLWRVQLVYWPFYAVFVVYACVRLSRGETEVRWWEAGAVFLILATALVPVLFNALDLLRHAGAHAIADRPGLSVVWRSLKFGLLAPCAGGAWLLSKLAKTGMPDRRPGVAAWSLASAWWLAQPLGLFAFSWLTGNSLYVDRYLSLSLPGAALMASAGGALFLSGRLLRIATLLLGAGALFLAAPNTSWPPMHHNSDWRGAAQAIANLHLGPHLPLMVPSPFIEAQWPAWTPGYVLPGFLYAHLYAYPVTGRLFLLPFSVSPEAAGFMAESACNTLLAERHFVLYGGSGVVRSWTDWLRARPDFAPWHSRKLGRFGDVEAVLFEAP